MLDIGPVLVGMTRSRGRCSLYGGKGQARDYVDVHAALAYGAYSEVSLLDLATRADDGFDPYSFGRVLAAVDDRPQTSSADYGLDETEIDALRDRLRDRLRDWGQRLLRDSEAGRENQPSVGPWHPLLALGHPRRETRCCVRSKPGKNAPGRLIPRGMRCGMKCRRPSTVDRCGFRLLSAGSAATVVAGRTQCCGLIRPFNPRVRGSISRLFEIVSNNRHHRAPP